jgi:tetratricopeptide (TPR) repeat protein
MRLIAAAALVLDVAVPVAARAQSDSALRAGERLFDGRRYEEARQALTAAWQADPHASGAAYYLGRIAIVDGDADRAVRWLQRATALDSGRAEYFNWLGWAYSRQATHTGRLHAFFIAPRARDAFVTAVRLDPESVDARENLLKFYLVAPGMVGGSTAKAREQAREIARRSPFRGRLAAGMIAEAAKDDATAEREYRAAITEYPDSAQGYDALGALYQRRSRYDDALATYEQLLARRPGEAAAYYQIGRTASLSGRDLERGEQALTTYLARRPGAGDPPLASAYYRLGLVCERKGEAARARAAYAEALRHDPKQRDARNALSRVR